MAGFVDSIATPPRTLTDGEVAKLLEVTGQHKDGFRDHMIYSMALGTGLREHEILGLDVGDLFSAGGTPKRHVQLRTFKASNPDPHQQVVVLSERLRAKLRKLWEVKQSVGEGTAAGDPVFVSNRGVRLSARMVRHGFGTWQERAGFERRHNFHALRHTACTNLYRASKDLRLCQRFARHADVRSTQIYTHPSDEAHLRAVQSLPC